jgi:glycosyltransferase involved in cell wall biosynthesis
VRVLSFGYDTNLLMPEDLRNESQARQAHYCDRLDQRRTLIVMTMQPMALSEQYLFGNQLHIVQAYGRRAWTRIWRAYQIGERMTREFKPDLVEYQDPRLAGVAAYAVAQKHRLPLVGGLFNSSINQSAWLRQRFSHYLYNAMGLFVLKRTNYVRSNSRMAVESLTTNGSPPIEYIPFYVPWLEKFAASDEIQWTRLQRWRDDPVILCVARLAEQKNLALLLKAFANVYHMTHRGQLVIIGHGPLEIELKTLATTLDISARVRWAGSVNYLDLPQAYFEANVFALSSDFEGSARVLVLAQAAGLPTITTETSGARDVVRENLTGVIVPIGDLQGLTSALTRLLTDENAYTAMLNLGHYSALEEYGEAVINGPLRAFYAKAVQSSARDDNKQPRKLL